MSKKRKIVLWVIIILIIAAGALIAFKIFYKSETPKKVATTIDSIDGYDYKLEDRDTKLYEEEFKTLKQNLESDDIDYKEYAESVAKMFIIDLYTIDNKVNKYDVGGVEFVHSKALSNYELNVENTIYKYVADNSYNDRDQQLPEVSDITIDNVEETTYEITCFDDEEDCENQELDAYEITLSWDYKEDLDYDSKAVVIVVREDNLMVVVEKKDVENTEIEE